jgi:hypothetical protein
MFTNFQQKLAIFSKIYGTVNFWHKIAQNILRQIFCVKYFASNILRQIFCAKYFASNILRQK